MYMYVHVVRFYFVSQSKNQKKVVKTCDIIPANVYRSRADRHLHQVDEDVVGMVLDGALQQYITDMILAHMLEDGGEGRHEKLQAVEVEL